MDKKLKDEWIKALRSGKYKQGTGTLCKLAKDGTRRHCCLGVLSEIIEGKKLALEKVDDKVTKTFANDLGDMGYDVVKLVGSTAIENELIAMNDARRCKFSTIANYIEKNL